MAFEKMTPPGPDTQVLLPPQALVDRDGGFFDGLEALSGNIPRGVLVPTNLRGNPMSPVEASSGIPLPIIAAKGKSGSNRHHVFFFEKDYVAGPLSVQAVRYSRLQKVGIRPHTRFHQVFEGTAMPETPADAYATTILSCAGYIPRFGIKIVDREVSISELTRTERNNLRKPGVFIMERRSNAQAKVGKFLMEYALSQDFSQLEQKEVEEFLSISDVKMRKNDVLRQRKLRLGLRLTNKAIAQAVDPINSSYRTARKQHALRQNTPPTPWEVAKLQINGRERDYIKTLEARLSDQLLAA